MPPLPVHSMRDRNRLLLGEVGPGAVQASDRCVPAAGQQQWTFRFGDSSLARRARCQYGEQGGCAVPALSNGCFVDDEILEREIVGAVDDVLGNVEQNRAGRPDVAHRKRIVAAPASGDAGSHPRRGSAPSLGGPEDFDLTGSWVMFFQECMRVGITSDRDNRDAAVQRFNEPSDEVGGTGAESAVADGAVGDLRIGVSGECATALVVAKVVVQAGSKADSGRRTAAGWNPPMPNVGPAPAQAAASRRARPPVIVPDGRFCSVGLIVSSVMPPGHGAARPRIRER